MKEIQPSIEGLAELKRLELEGWCDRVARRRAKQAGDVAMVEAVLECGRDLISWHVERGDAHALHVLDIVGASLAMYGECVADGSVV